jgi:2-dehydro-3-deoxygalactonokinase
MEASVETALIGVDWGTSRLRGLRIDSTGRLLEHRESTHGVACVQDRAFDAALHELIADWQRGHVPVLMCGMIGSRQGWHEVPYVPCPAGLPDFLASWQSIETSCGPAHIVPGASIRDAGGLHDVMRGEEMQIFGIASTTGRQLAIAPGTHSKWATVENERICGFKTYMTGELYSLLRERSTLAWVMPPAGEVSPNEDAFIAGVRRMRDDPELLHLLFSVRTCGLFDDLPAAALPSYLSGLLIGGEIATGLRQVPAGEITLIASTPLADLYRLALSDAGYPDVACVEATAAAARGLWRLWELRAQGS